MTLFAAVMETIQVPVPVQAPDQPEKVDPADGEAVSVTEVPELYEAVQVAPQEMPAGLEVTVPLPVPALVTVMVYDTRVKVAVTLRAAVMETVHVPVPVQAPDQPVKVEPAAGAAVKVTEVLYA